MLKRTTANQFSWNTDEGRIEAATAFIEICITLPGGSYKFSKDTQSFLNQSYPGRWSLGANQLSGPKSGLNQFTRNRVLVPWEAFRAGHKGA